MATRDLIELIKCSNYAGTTGQSFRNNVAGAASGAKMSDYIATGLNWTGGPAGAGLFPQDTGHVYSMVGNFLGGSRIGNIIRQGSGLFTISSVTIGAGGSVTLNSSNVSGSSASANVEIVAPYNPGATASMAGSATYYYSGADQTSPPASGTCQAHFSARVSGSGGTADGGYDNVTFYLGMTNINAYTGNFNVTPAAQLFTAATNHRAILYTEFTVEWHANSSYTSLVSSNPDYYADEAVFAPSSPPSGGYTLYLRYKGPGVSIWTNYGAVTFIDSRLTY